MCRLPRLVSMDSAFNDSRTGYGLAWTSAGHGKRARCFLCSENAPDDSCAAKTRPMLPDQSRSPFQSMLRLHQSTSQRPSNPISCLPHLRNNPHEPILLVGRLRYLQHDCGLLRNVGDLVSQRGNRQTIATNHFVVQ